MSDQLPALYDDLTSSTTAYVAPHVFAALALSRPTEVVRLMDRMIDVDERRLDLARDALPIVREANRLAAERHVVSAMGSVLRDLILTATPREHNFGVDVRTPEMGHFSMTAYRY